MSESGNKIDGNDLADMELDALFERADYLLSEDHDIADLVERGSDHENFKVQLKAGEVEAGLGALEWMLESRGTATDEYPGKLKAKIDQIEEAVAELELMLMEEEGIYIGDIEEIQSAVIDGGRLVDVSQGSVMGGSDSGEVSAGGDDEGAEGERTADLGSEVEKLNPEELVSDEFLMEEIRSAEVDKDARRGGDDEGSMVVTEEDFDAELEGEDGSIIHDWEFSAFSEEEDEWNDSWENEDENV